MSHSDDHDALIDTLFEGSATPEEAARLLGAMPDDELAELAELVDTLRRLDGGRGPGTAAPGFELPSVERFRDARRSVLARIAEPPTAGRPVAAPRTRQWGRVARWLPLAAALAAFAVGLALGRGEAEPVAELTLADLVSRGAGGTAAGGSAFRYSNLRLREVGADALAVTVDVEAELELVRPKNDLLMSDILASSLESDEPLGTRLKALRHAGSSPRVRQALATAVRRDPDVSVRLKALARLIEQDVASAETQETLLAVLAEEESVAMRLLALEAIEDDYLGADLLDGLDPDEDEGALLWRAQQRLSRRSL